MRVPSQATSSVSSGWVNCVARQTPYTCPTPMRFESLSEVLAEVLLLRCATIEPLASILPVTTAMMDSVMASLPHAVLVLVDGRAPPCTWGALAMTRAAAYESVGGNRLLLY